MYYIRTFFAAIILISCIVIITPAASAAESLAVAVNQSRVLNLSNVERVAIANPDIADVLVVSGSEVLLVGKAPGATTLHIWSAAGRSSYLIEVAAADIQSASEIKAVLGYENIRVTKVGKTIILEGQVTDQYQKNRAGAVAAAYGDKVVNLLELTKPVQVKIEAKVIEINRSKEQDLGIKWGNGPQSSPGIFNFGQDYVNPITGGKTFGNLGGYSAVNAQLNALIKNGTAKVLSQPNMVTLSGDKAEILVGGQIPVPISAKDGQITVEWKDYGIKLAISPEVNAENLISSTVKAEVSSLDWSSSASIYINGNMRIPPMLTRKADTAIVLSSGQTMAIGGLISNETHRDVQKLPLLGDLPVIGNLFKNTSFTRNETELIILITPTIVDPAEYIPQSSEEMQAFAKENPWGGTNNGGKNKGVNR